MLLRMLMLMLMLLLLPPPPQLLSNVQLIHLPSAASDSSAAADGSLRVCAAFRGPFRLQHRILLLSNATAAGTALASNWLHNLRYSQSRLSAPPAAPPSAFRAAALLVGGCAHIPHPPPSPPLPFPSTSPPLHSVIFLQPFSSSGAMVCRMHRCSRLLCS